MANFNGTARSNYVRLRDGISIDDARRVINIFGLVELEVITQDEKGAEQTLFGLYSDDPDTGCWPTRLRIDDNINEDDIAHLARCLEITADDAEKMIDEIVAADGDYEFSWEDHIMPMVAEGEVFIVMEAGAEKLRYISGYAEAYCRKGKEVGMTALSLYDIYEKASGAFGVETSAIQEATY